MIVEYLVLDYDDCLPDGDALVGLVAEHHGALILLAILTVHCPHLVTHLTTITM